jgi:hypothetical protein
MPLSTAATAGIVIAILFTLSLLFAFILFTNRRHRLVPKPLDDESPSLAAEGDASPSMSPLTLVGPKKRTNNDHHHRYPSLENGPGPTITKPPRSKLAKYRPATPGPNGRNASTPIAKTAVEATPTPASATTVPSTAGSTATVLHHTQRPGTSGTNRPSSLHQAVLGKQEEAMVKAVEEASEKLKAAAEKIKAKASVDKEMEGDAKPRRYTGAWP